MIGLCHIFAGGEDFADDAAVDECGEFFGLAKIDSTIIYLMGFYYINQSRFDSASDTSTLWDI